ncbi:MAG: hypothetical protein SW833_04740 [Cyanobacteriota bacterium]|nr:hypothetical protein [Cyanobacteriota bacterium]
MNIEDLEKKLDRGEEWGFRKVVDNSDYLGWVLLAKRKPPIVFPKETYETEETYISLREWSEKLKRTPYHILVLELKREVHESGDYEDNDDYRQRESYYLSTLQEVEEFIENLGYSLQNIQFSGDIDPP